MKVIPDSLLSCFERISSERYGLLYDLAAEGLFSLTELERIVEEFTIQRYNFAKIFHESAKAISLKADIDARNVISRISPHLSVGLTLCFMRHELLFFTSIDMMKRSMKNMIPLT